MDMNVLKYLAFVRTVECGSFTKASEVLHYSQSGISRMISDLEKEWNLTLLERSRVGIRLTSEGLRLLPYARKVCEDFGNLQAQVDDLNGLHSGIIRIGTISSIAAHWLPNMIIEFQKKYPNIDYELLLGHYAEIEEWIQEGRVDAGFTKVPTKTKLFYEILERDRLLAVLPEDHPLAGCEKFPVSAFAEYPFMLLENGGTADISAFLEKAGVKPRVHFTTVDDFAIMSMVEKGLGISILPELILKRTPYRVVIRELDVPAYRELGIARKSEEITSLALQRFLEYTSFRTDDR